MKELRTLGLSLALLVVCTSASADLVKKSSSGLCHPPESSWYERTKNYKAFDSTEDCLDSGGRLPSGLSLRDIGVERKSVSDYRPYGRDYFRHWIDGDSDCQDTRAEFLISKSTRNPTFADADKHCRVVSGRWVSLFTGNILYQASDVEIDHVVPLKWAWEHGAWRWSGQERETFANDPINMLAVEDELNILPITI